MTLHKYAYLVTFSLEKMLSSWGAKWPEFTGVFEIIKVHFFKPIIALIRRRLEL